MTTIINQSSNQKKIAIYARCSTSSQDPTNQLIELRSYAERSNHIVVDEYVDYAKSGVKGRNERPEFDRLCKDITRRKFDLVATFDASRLSRSVKHLCEFIEEIQSSNVDLYLHTQGISTDTPSGRALLQMVGVFSSLERELMRERIVAGIARAKSEGTKFGRPTNVNNDTVAAIRVLREKGVSIRKVASTLGIGVGTIYKLQREAA